LGTKGQHAIPRPPKPLGSSLGGQGDVKEVALLWLNEMFISHGESLIAKKKSAVADFSAEE
jgi:hypothetical protein